MHPVEFTFYKGLVLLASAIAITFGIINLVYFNRIRVDGNCEDISVTTATTMIWLNIVLVAFASITFFWSLFRLIHTGQKEKDVIHKTYNTHVHDYPSDVTSLLSPGTSPTTPASRSPAPIDI